MIKKLSTIFSFFLVFFIFLSLHTEVLADACGDAGGICTAGAGASGFENPCTNGTLATISCGNSSTFCCVAGIATTPTSTPVPTTATPTSTPVPTATVTLAPTPTTAPGAITTPTSTPVPGSISLNSGNMTGEGWVPDPEVNFVGKDAARAGLLLDWALDSTNYQWVYLSPQFQNGENPLLPFWTNIRNIVYALLILLVLVSAFILIATRGRSITVKRFIPRFLAIVLLVTFSFAIIQLLYQIGDIIQLFFLKSPTYSTATTTVNISQKDLLYVGWSYASFIGLRLSGDPNTEAAFMALLLVKLTSITYYVMVGVLIVRKIILWFFIILSPVFPLLLLYKPIRNTGKIWIGEFFRWLMYAPLFAIFLAGLVSLWTSAIPLNFTQYTNAKLIGQDPTTPPLSTTSNDLLDRFPTAINIELGAPKQNVSLNNSVNYVETYAEYVVALLMLWVVILLPFVLLQIFLDYMNTVSFSQTAWMQQLIARSPSFLKPSPFSSPSPPTPPEKYQPTGLAKALPYDDSIAMPIPLAGEAFHVPSRVNSEILEFTNLSIPTMQDIARFETSQLSSSSNSQQQETTRIKQSLEKIANPVNALHERLEKESQKGNMLAQNILNAASSSVSDSNISSVQQAISTISNPASASLTVERMRASELRQTIMQEGEKGNSTANTFISTMNTLNRTELTNISQILEKLANPSVIKDLNQQKEFIQLRDSLTRESQMGNPVATSILAATKTTTSKKTDIATLTKMREQLQLESKKGNRLATEILSSTDKTTATETQALLQKLTSAKQKGESLAAKILAFFAQQGVKTTSKTPSLPLTNRVQAVSIEDYEAVKKMWLENYQKLDVPQGIDGKRDRKSWISSDVDAIGQTIDLLSSTDQEKQAAGMQQVSSILPFLLIGGFSQTEIIAYLKAKQQAGKEVLEQLSNTENEDETTISDEKKTGSAGTPQIMQAEEQSIDMQLSTRDSELLSLTNLTLPTISDIAKLEISPLKLQKAKGSLISLAAKNVATGTLRARLQTAKEEGNDLATAILQAADEASADSAQVTQLPKTNNIQTVNVEDYEVIKQLWQDNYEKAEVPGMTDRKMWLNDETASIDKLIDLLSRDDKQSKEQGMKQVLGILPFLLLGGFSLAETILYLKAKKQAAKTVLDNMEKQDIEQNSLVTAKTTFKKEEKSEKIEE